VLAERCDEAELVPLNVVQVDAFEAELDVAAKPVGMLLVSDTRTASVTSSGRTNLRTASKSAGMRRSVSRRLSSTFVPHSSCAARSASSRVGANES
jgi:hypothetical protein